MKIIIAFAVERIICFSSNRALGTRQGERLENVDSAVGQIFGSENVIAVSVLLAAFFLSKGFARKLAFV